MNRTGNKKAMGGAFLMVVIVVALGLVVLSSTLGWFLWSMKESVDIYNRYTIAGMDAEIQSLKQVFEKTAAFHSIMDTAKEFAEHGGHAAEALEDSNSNSIADATEAREPKILVKKDLDSDENIAQWTIPNCETTLKRVPNLMDKDVNRLAGEETITLMQNNQQHMQYIDEINAGEYPLYVSLQLFIIKPGTVSIACSSGCSNVMPDGHTEPIEKDGIYTYKITRIDSTASTSIRVTAKNETGEIDDVVLIKEVKASIYDPEKIITQNTLFTQHLNNYRDTLADILDKRNEESEIKLAIAPLSGTLTRSRADYVEGTVWPAEEEGSITATTAGMLDPHDSLAELRDSGVITEEAKIRYYTLYDNAEKFTDISEDLLKYRLWNRLNSDFENASDPEKEFCDHSLCPPGCSDCPHDTVPDYSENDFQEAIQNELDDIKTELDASTNPGRITWTLTLAEDTFDTCQTNTDTSACNPLSCNSHNIEHHEYKKGKIESGGCSCGCSGYHFECYPGGIYTDHKSHCNKARITTCYMHYRHRYILKNLKIQVTITDEAYKYYDTTTNSWENLEFKYYVTMPFIDDNCCDGQLCSDMATVCANPYPVTDASV